MNQAFIEKTQRWAAARGIALSIKNREEHWIFEKGGKVVEWWPSTNRLSVDHRLGYCASSWQDVMERVEKTL